MTRKEQYHRVFLVIKLLPKEQSITRLCEYARVESKGFLRVTPSTSVVKHLIQFKVVSSVVLSGECFDFDLVLELTKEICRGVVSDLLIQFPFKT